MDKDYELQKARKDLRDAQDKLHALEQERLKEVSKDTVGKCFKEWFDTGDPYTEYLKVTGLDGFGSPCGFWFWIYDSGDVRFSLDNHPTSFSYQELSNMKQIKLEEYVLAWGNILEFIRGEE